MATVQKKVAGPGGSSQQIFCNQTVKKGVLTVQ